MENYDLMKCDCCDKEYKSEDLMSCIVNDYPDDFLYIDHCEDYLFYCKGCLNHEFICLKCQMKIKEHKNKSCTLK